MEAVFPPSASALARGRRLRRRGREHDPRARRRTVPVTFAEIKEVDEETEEAGGAAGGEAGARRGGMRGRRDLLEGARAAPALRELSPPEPPARALSEPAALPRAAPARALSEAATDCST